MRTVDRNRVRQSLIDEQSEVYSKVTKLMLAKWVKEYWWCAENLVVRKSFEVVIMLMTEGRLKVVTLGRIQIIHLVLPRYCLLWLCGVC